jgi:hypothetical protein
MRLRLLHIVENSHVGLGLSGDRGQQMHAALERDDMTNFNRPLEFGPGNAAPGQFGL